MRRLLAAIALALTIASCGGAAATSSNASTERPTATTTVPASTSTAAAAATAAATASTTKASANNATNAELIAALTANGVPNPANWAREVQEYRPYSTSDTSFAKLKGELAKYNPSADTLSKILASLSLP